MVMPASLPPLLPPELPPEVPPELPPDPPLLPELVPPSPVGLDVAFPPQAPNAATQTTSPSSHPLRFELIMFTWPARGRSVEGGRRLRRPQVA
jgi:hypothetical protein